MAINLARGKVIEKKRKVGKILVIPTGIFLIVFIASIGLVGYNFSLKQEQSRLDEEKAELAKKIETYSSRKSKSLLIHDRLSYIERILSSRITLYKKGTDILDIIPSSIKFGSIDVSQDSVTLNVSADSLSDVNELFERIEQFGASFSSLKRVGLSSFASSPTIEHVALSLSFEFDKH